MDAREQFDDFVRGRGAALQRTAYLLTGDWALAEDLVQTALARSWPAWGRIHHGDPEGNVRRVLVNTHASWWRRRWRGEVPTLALPDRAGAEQDGGRDDRPTRHAALLRLPPRQRAVVVLRFSEDLSEAATAEMLGISTGTVKSTTSKALARLRADGALAELAPTTRGAQRWATRTCCAAAWPRSGPTRPLRPTGSLRSAGGSAGSRTCGPPPVASSPRQPRSGPPCSC
ncbi:MAG: SigE family RNA polymerase sigma factor [Pseudorhodobacter sp.]|nr:SigE family RNA polymerase sigma factor [Frankiaceae bacterium]